MLFKNTVCHAEHREASRAGTPRETLRDCLSLTAGDLKVVSRGSE